MPRAMDAGFLAAIQASTIRPVTLVEVDFPTGIIFGHTRIGPIEHGGQDYQGLGDFLAVTPIRGAGGLEAIGVTVTLSGIAPTYLPIVLGQHYRGRRLRIWQGMMAENGSLAGVAGPWRFWIDAPEIAYGSTCSVTVQAEGIAARLGRPVGRSWTDAEHQERWPGDRFFEYAPQAADRELVWPAVPGAPGSPVNHSRTSSVQQFVSVSPGSDGGWTGDGGHGDDGGGSSDGSGAGSGAGSGEGGGAG